MTQYFESNQELEKQKLDMNFFTSFFTDNNPEKLRSALKRIWLDDFLN